MRLDQRWPPVPAGILIGVSMLLAWIVAGRGIGASGGMTRFVAWVQHGLFPAATEQSAYFGKYFANGAHPLNDYVVFLLAGLLIGSFVAARSCTPAGSFSTGLPSARRDVDSSTWCPPGLLRPLYAAILIVSCVACGCGSLPWQGSESSARRTSSKSERVCIWQLLCSSRRPGATRVCCLSRPRCERAAA